MNIDSIKDGVVIDHITAGNAMRIYKLLGFDKLECSVAIIKNVSSKKMGKKDIITCLAGGFRMTNDTTIFLLQCHLFSNQYRFSFQLHIFCIFKARYGRINSIFKIIFCFCFCCFFQIF